MKTFAEIEARIEDITRAAALAAGSGGGVLADAGAETGTETGAQISQRPEQIVAELMQLGETCLEHWNRARGDEPTEDTKEGFRLLALHRQGAKGDPSFNACRETCRELVYHYNLIALEPTHEQTPQRLKLAAMVARHLCYFIGGKMQTAELGEFCCSSKPLRSTGS